MDHFLKEFILLWAVIDPIGTVPVFIALTARHSARQRKVIALRAALIAAGVLTFFLVAGQLVLEGMEVSLPAFQVAGGIVLFLFALTMIFGESKPEQELEMKATPLDVAVFPLAVPSIAGPGAMMAIVLLTDNHRFSFGEQVTSLLVMLLVIACALLLMLGAGRIQKLIGDTGASIISRVMGLILASVAIEGLLSGIRSFFDVQG